MPAELESFRPKDRGYRSPSTSWRYTELATALEWGLTPAQFSEQEEEDKAEMVAFLSVKGLLESWHYEMSEKQSKLKDTATQRNMGR